MLSHLFEIHGRFCAGHPLEVIVTTFTLTACILNMETGNGHPRDTTLPLSLHCRPGRCNSDDLNAADIIVMTIIRCLAILFTYHQFRNLQRLGSKYILGIAGLFTVFSSVVFTSSVVNFGRSDISDLKDALFFFLLIIDLSKAAILAQLALSSRSQEEVRANIARGMSLLGPTITLDTLVETLLISIGSLSGVRRLEILCSFACFGVVVNYIVFMTFYPACLSLILEVHIIWKIIKWPVLSGTPCIVVIQDSPLIISRLQLSRGTNSMKPLSADKIFMMHPLNEEDQKPNPVVERVKLIMIAGLFVVHANSRWPFKSGETEHTVEGKVSSANSHIIVNSYNKTENTSEVKEYLMNWLSVSADNIVILILLLALAIKFIFFEDKGDIAKQLRFRAEDEAEEKIESEYAKEKRIIREYMKERKIEGEYVKEKENESEDVNMLSCKMPFRRNIARMHAVSLPAKLRDWMDDKEVQIDEKECGVDTWSDKSVTPSSKVPRSVEECLKIYESELGANALTDEEVIQLVKNKHIAAYQLEKAVGDMERGVGIRRLIIGEAGKFYDNLSELPYKDYDYSKVLGSCCENVVGYVPVPLGIAGPLLVDGELYHVPMATTEGCLVASTNRGSRALLKCGVTSRVVADGMTRGPVVRFPNIVRASEAMAWMQEPDNFKQMKECFDLTSRFARLTKIHVRIAGRHVFIRFVATTGDAMGMNMLSKGTEKALNTAKEHFPDMEILSLSGNFCADKKPAAVNWIHGRGKSVVCEAVVPADIVTNVLKTSVHALVDVNISKNMIGSAVAGSIGGFNAHAANIVTAIFIATGQDPAQNVASSNCMTLMEPWGADGSDLYVSCTMPSIEIGTIGGGTGLPAQGACLAMLGVKGAHAEQPGENASRLARIVCATVLAGELSLMAALTAGHLVKSHLRHNRSSTTVTNAMSVPQHNTGDNLSVPNVLQPVQNVCKEFIERS